jgi:hypothetical protein
MKRKRIPETALAAAVVAHFRSIPGAVVYQEVGDRGGRADIVARLGPVFHVVECKVSFGLDVLRQAAEWRTHAHRVSIATPSRHGYDHPSAFDARLVESLDLGWFCVGHDAGFDKETERFTGEEWSCREVVLPKLRRDVSDYLAKTVTPEHETFAPAGNADGKFWSPWRATCKALREFVKKHPGCTLKDAVAGISHHYRRDTSARTSLSHWIGAKDLGVEWREVEGKRGLYVSAELVA